VHDKLKAFGATPPKDQHLLGKTEEQVSTASVAIFK